MPHWHPEKNEIVEESYYTLTQPLMFLYLRD